MLSSKETEAGLLEGCWEVTRNASEVHETVPGFSCSFPLAFL